MPPSTQTTPKKTSTLERSVKVAAEFVKGSLKRRTDSTSNLLDDSGDSGEYEDVVIGQPPRVPPKPARRDIRCVCVLYVCGCVCVWVSCHLHDLATATRDSGWISTSMGTSYWVHRKPTFFFVAVAWPLRWGIDHMHMRTIYGGGDSVVLV